MRGLSKKMLISILTSVVVFVTMIATTFAWVGIFTYASTDSFSLNLKVSKLDVNYFLTISATGRKDDFSEEADLVEIQRQILKNQHLWSDEEIDDFDSFVVKDKYSKHCTTTPSSCLIENNKLTDFYSIRGKITDYYDTYNTPLGYLKFDLYLSVGAKEGIQPETEINTNVFLADIEKTLQGTICEQKLTNLNPYKKMPSIPEEYNTLLTLPDNNFFNINSANATRFAFCIYEPIDVNESYDDSYNPIKTLIYQGGKKIPSFNGSVYDLGGNLPEDYNTALQELLIIRPNYNSSIQIEKNEHYYNDLNNAVARGENDLELTEVNSKIWDKPSDIDSSFYLGVHNGIQTKMKVTVYFWFEGWDSDCILGINEKPVTMNLNFTAGIED